MAITSEKTINQYKYKLKDKFSSWATTFRNQRYNEKGLNEIEMKIKDIIILLANCKNILDDDKIIKKIEDQIEIFNSNARNLSDTFSSFKTNLQRKQITDKDIKNTRNQIESLNTIVDNVARALDIQVKPKFSLLHFIGL